MWNADMGGLQDRMDEMETDEVFSLQTAAEEEEEENDDDGDEGYSDKEDEEVAADDEEEEEHAEEQDNDDEEEDDDDDKVGRSMTTVHMRSNMALLEMFSSGCCSIVTAIFLAPSAPPASPPPAPVNPCFLSVSLSSSSILPGESERVSMRTRRCAGLGTELRTG